MKKKRILLIDNSSIMHHVKHSGLKKLKSTEKSSYIMLGYMMRLQYMMAKSRANICVFARDGHPDDSIRKKIYPLYKEKRIKEKTDEQKELDSIAYPQFTEIEECILPDLGYQNIFQEKRLEADDIIGSICKKYYGHEIIIVTTDQDMYQLLTDTTCIMHSQTTDYFTKAKFVKKYGIEPRMWKRVKAIAGCTSDEVKGIPGVAEKTVLKYLKGTLPDTYKAYKDIQSKEGREIINRNKSLVILPFRGTPEYKIKEDYLSKSRLQSVAKRYGFKAILNDLDNWFTILKG